MDQICKDKLTKGKTFICMDDILIATNGTPKEHQQEVEEVLQILADNDLYLKPEKCKFHRKEVEYLGMIVGNNCIKMDPIKVKGIADWPVPTTVKELRAFFWFWEFLQRFYCPLLSHWTTTT